MRLQINRAAQTSIFTQNYQRQQWKISSSQGVIGDHLRISNPVAYMKDRLLEHNGAVSFWDERVIQGDDRMAIKSLKSVDKAVSNVGKTLEEMKTLSMMAEDESLSDGQRIDLQIQMIRLQSRLYKDTHRMTLEVSGKSSMEIEKMLSHDIDGAEEILIAFMENMKTRIKNGDYTPRSDGIDLSDFAQVQEFCSFDENGEPKRTVGVWRLAFKGGAGDLGLSAAAMEDPDYSGMQGTLLGVAITNIECAKESTERIQTQIDALTEFKDEFRQFYTNVPKEGYDDGGRDMELDACRGKAGALSPISKTDLLNPQYRDRRYFDYDHDDDRQTLERIDDLAQRTGKPTEAVPLIPLAAYLPNFPLSSYNSISKSLRV